MSATKYPEVGTRGVLKKGDLKNFAKFTGKHLCQSLIFNKVAGIATLLKRRLWHRCFSVNFEKFLRARFLQSTSERLLLNMVNVNEMDYGRWNELKEIKWNMNNKFGLKEMRWNKNSNVNNVTGINIKMPTESY